jgi:hypothetical protein
VYELVLDPDFPTLSWFLRLLIDRMTVMMCTGVAACVSSVRLRYDPYRRKERIRTK